LNSLNNEPLHLGAAFSILPAIMEIPMAETSSPDFLSDERFIKEHRRVSVMFIGRDGYSKQMSTQEFSRLRETVRLDACPKAYLRLQRTGSRFALDWHNKIEIAEIYHKAGEHAYYGYCVALGINPE
jgi:hypothetical protein